MVGLILEDYKLVVKDINNSLTSFEVKLEKANTLLRQTFGFMFSRDKNKIILFDMKKECRYSITNMLVFFPIDLIFLDKNKRVVDIKREFKPFSFRYSVKQKYNYFIEIPSVLNITKNIKLGSFVEFRKRYF